MEQPTIKLDTYPDLSALVPDRHLRAILIRRGFTSASAIANASRSDFVAATREHLGVTEAARVHAVANAQSSLLNNVLTGVMANAANGFSTEIDGRDLAQTLPIAQAEECHCEDCQNALSPLAYLADLLDYAMKHVKSNNAPITLQFLTDTFHQPFGTLPATCEMVNTLVRQVRLCIEVLRSYLSAIPPTSVQQVALSSAEKAYRLAAY